MQEPLVIRENCYEAKEDMKLFIWLLLQQIWWISGKKKCR